MLNILNCKCSEKWAGFAPLILRVVVGITFVYAGWSKIQMGTEAISGFFAGAGIPLASVMAPFVMWLEFLGGIALILGIWTHLVSKLLSIVMIVAIFTVHLSSGFGGAMGYQLPLTLLAILISLMITGPGKFAVNLKKSAPIQTV
jgi:putative oxidoreductase